MSGQSTTGASALGTVATDVSGRHNPPTLSTDPSPASEVAVAEPPRRFSVATAVFLLAVLAALVLPALGERTDQGIVLFGGLVPYAFVLFVVVLLGVALFHHQTLYVALGGAVVITTYTALFCPGFEFSAEQTRPGLLGHFVYEGEHTLLNLGGLLLGFALLADFFERSHVPAHLPRLLPRSAVAAAFMLLAAVWFISSFLDNIAAAMIGGVMASKAFRGRVTIGYLAAIVAASNAGGAWSVVGDTTTTMMWIDGVAAIDVVHCFIASVVALLVCGLPIAAAQVRHQAVALETGEELPRIDALSLVIVVAILAGAILANV